MSYVPDTNLEKRKKGLILFYNIVLQILILSYIIGNYKMIITAMVVGILDEECNIVVKSGGITPSPPAPEEVGNLVLSELVVILIVIPYSIVREVYVVKNVEVHLRTNVHVNKKDKSINTFIFLI